MGTYSAAGGVLVGRVDPVSKTPFRLIWRMGALNPMGQALFSARRTSHRTGPGLIRHKMSAVSHLQRALSQVVWTPAHLRQYWKRSPRSLTSPTLLPNPRLHIPAISSVVSCAHLCPGTRSSCRIPKFPSPVFSTSCPVCGWGSRRIQWIFTFSTGKSDHGSLFQRCLFVHAKDRKRPSQSVEVVQPNSSSTILRNTGKLYQ